MPINITTVGGAGTHSFSRTNVNLQENYIYYKNVSGDVIPAAMSSGKTFIYTPGIGSLTGLTSGDLVYVVTTNPKQLKLSFTSGGAAVDLTNQVAGSIKFNTPIVYANKLNIDGQTANRQAVKYYTDSTPLTGLVSGNTYFLRNVSISDFAGAQALYTLTSNTHTFTSGGVTGATGPTITQLRTAYTTASAWRDTYLRQGDYQGYQDWTVPVSGTYEFNVRGASGFDGNGSGTPGRGAIVQGRVQLTKGETITIVVGQRGAGPATGNTWGGSGGGTFVVRKTGKQPLFIAGGGSAEAFSGAGKDGHLGNIATTSTGNISSGGNTGFGGVSTGGYSAGGGGFLGRGENGPAGEIGGGSFQDGLTINSSNLRTGGYGGFGGGGQSDGNQQGQSGGAGGYSGGGGARTTSPNHAGGGGGSFITTTATNVGTSTGLWEGSSTFNAAAITNLAAYNTGDGQVTVTLVNSFTTGHTVHPTAADADANTNAIAITPAGSSYHAFVPITVDLGSNTFHFPDAHNLITNDAITYTSSGTLVGGMSLNTIYYVEKIDNFSYQISTSPTLTPKVDLTSPSFSTDDTFAKVIVNTATNTLTIPSHGFLANQPIRYQTNGGAPIAPLQNNATYYVKQVVDQNTITLSQSLNGPVIDLTAPGTGVGHSFLYVVVNVTEDSIYIPGHDLVTGQRIIYSNGGGTTIGGLTNGAQYFIFKVDNNIVKLSTNKAGTAIVNLTSTGTGNHTLTTNSVDFATNTISIPSHGFSQGELVQYDSVGQTAIGGLTSGNPYYIILIDGDNIKLATSLENANAGTAVDITTAGVGRHRILSLSKSPDGTYTIATIPSPTTFTVSAGGFVPAIVKTFTPRTVVDTQQNNIKILSHGFLTTTKVRYSNNGGTSIGGLTHNTDYYVVAINKDYLRLATSVENAASGIVITFTDFGAGVDHTLTSFQINGNVTGSGTVTTSAGGTLVTGFNTAFSKILKVGDRLRIFPPNTTNSKTFTAANVSTGADTITITSHGFVTTDVVQFLQGTGVAPGGLTTAQYYYIGRVDANTVKLYNSASDANSGTGAVDFTTTGTGTDFSLTKTIPASPIIRRITAIGSDTQVTVDRAYASTYTAVSYAYSTFIYTRPQGYNLHRPFDGGVEMSVGIGTSWAQIIRQTRKYFRYQSGKGLQTSFGINFKPTIDLEELTAISSTTFQAKTRRPHGLINGLYIEISQSLTSTGATSTLYNGVYQVTVLDSTTFTCLANTTLPTTGAEVRAYGFPQFYVRFWTNGAVRAGMFDFQNGMFYEYDGQKIWAVRRSSTQQIAGTAAALQGTEFVFGSGTTFTTQLAVGDYIVMRGQSYKVSSIISDTRLTIKPEYKGSTGTEKEFNPSTVVTVADDLFTIQGHGFSNNLPVIYNSIDGTPIGGLINGRTYYVDLIDNNSFKLKATPDAVTDVAISSQGAGTPHSFIPAKSGIIVTKTVDTRVPQEEWSIDKCDGTGPTGYNLNLGTIQMAYIDYSWYGAGKIRFGFKTKEGEVQYVHEFIHNNYQLESYFRSGNLPTRYEVVTFDSPTYIPFLFHWGTSVIMDGKFDDDKAYLFSQNSNTLSISGTTTKTFGSNSVLIATDRINIPAHGFATGDPVVFEGRTRQNLIGTSINNPQTANTVFHPYTNLQNALTYYVRAIDANNIALHASQADALFNSGAGQNTIDLQTQGNTQYTFYIYPAGAYNNSSGASYQPLLSIRLSPSVSSGLTGKLGDRDVINRMQLRMKEIAVSTTQLVDVKLLINPRLNNLNFTGVASPSLTQIIQHTGNDTVSGGTQIYNFRAAGGASGTDLATSVQIDDLFELSNSILGGDSVFPDGPDILTVAVSRLTGSATQSSAKLTWTEAQAQEETMAIVRLGAHTPDANTSYILYNVTTSHLVSVIASNTLLSTATTTKVDIWVVPQGVTVPSGYGYIVSNLELGVGQSFETFKFGISAGDTVFVRSTTAGTSFVIQGMSQDDEYSINDVPITFLNKVIRGNDNVIYPEVGSTAERPSAAETGYWRYNTDLDYIEFKTPSGWAAAAGPTGPQGIQGFQGVGLALKGSYSTLAALQAAYPTGNVGDGYVVGADLYIWDNAASLWELVGPIVGPTGPTGPEGGPTGPTGPAGPVGPAGSASAYFPATAGDWIDVPTTIDDALDELAARIKALEP